MDVVPSGMVSVPVRPSQPLNAHMPMVRRERGSSSAVRPTHFSNDWRPIDVVPSGIVSVPVKSWHLKNAPSAMVRSVCGSCSPEMPVRSEAMMPG